MSCGVHSENKIESNFELINRNSFMHSVGISTNQISIEEIINSRDDCERQEWLN